MKIGRAVSVFAISVLLIGCESFVTHSAGGLNPSDYIVLGAISYDDVRGDGYEGMLKAAMEVYPGTTDVIDIVPGSDMAVLSGIAIQRIQA